MRDVLQLVGYLLIVLAGGIIAWRVWLLTGRLDSIEDELAAVRDEHDALYARTTAAEETADTQPGRHRG